MRLARLGLLVGFVLCFDAGVAAAQDPPPSDAVDPWVTSGQANGASPTNPPAPSDATDPWKSEDQVAVPPKETRGIKKLPGPKPAAKKVVIVPQRPLKKGQIEHVAEGVPVAWFPGFLRLQNGGTRVFLELNKKVEVIEHKAEGRVVFRLRGAYTPDRTNRLPLLTGWIATPVERVQLAQEGGDTDLVIELREKSEYAFRVIDTPRGMALQVDFPPVVRTVKEREIGENGMPLAPERARLKTTSTRIDGGNSPF
jgi:hypothetical protein